MTSAAALFVPPLARGAAPGIETRTVDSVFFVAKSENKNQVHYGIRLDEACMPIGANPVFAYWRMFEHGPLATEPLLARELPAYGVGSQRLERSGAGARVVLTLNALPKRPIVIESTVGAATCTARATIPIGGVPASLGRVFVQLRWPFGVDHLMLEGRASGDGRVVRERVAL